MSKVILYVATSLDGYIATSDGDLGWLNEYLGDSIDYGFHEFLDSTDLNVMGANTYRQIRELDAKWPYTTKTYVASSSVLDAPEGADIEFIDKSPSELVDQAREHSAKNIWLIGGAKLAQSFLADGLIDELMLTVMPLALGDGIKLFDKTNERTRVRLVKLDTYDSGAYQVHYSVVVP